MSTEGGPKPEQSNFIRRMAERLHVVPTAEHQAAIDQQFIENLAELNKEAAERNKQVHMILEHSDAGCTSEVEYLLRMSSEDPHPGHPITFTECDHTFDEHGDVIVFREKV